MPGKKSIFYKFIIGVLAAFFVLLIALFIMIPRDSWGLVSSLILSSFASEELPAEMTQDGKDFLNIFINNRASKDPELSFMNMELRVFLNPDFQNIDAVKKLLHEAGFSISAGFTEEGKDANCDETLLARRVAIRKLNSLITEYRVDFCFKDGALDYFKARFEYALL